MIDNVRKVTIYLALAFVIVSVWHDPQGSAGAAGTFLHTVGGFFSALLVKGTQFLKGLAN